MRIPSIAAAHLHDFDITFSAVVFKGTSFHPCLRLHLQLQLRLRLRHSSSEISPCRVSICRDLLLSISCKKSLEVSYKSQIGVMTNSLQIQFFQALSARSFASDSFLDSITFSIQNTSSDAFCFCISIQTPQLTLLVMLWTMLSLGQRKYLHGDRYTAQNITLILELYA